MSQKISNKKQGDISKKTYIAKQQVVTNNQIEKGGKIWEEISTTNS